MQTIIRTRIETYVRFKHLKAKRILALSTKDKTNLSIASQLPRWFCQASGETVSLPLTWSLLPVVERRSPYQSCPGAGMTAKEQVTIGQICKCLWTEKQYHYVHVNSIIGKNLRNCSHCNLQGNIWRQTQIHKYSVSGPIKIRVGWKGRGADRSFKKTVLCCPIEGPCLQGQWTWPMALRCNIY